LQHLNEAPERFRDHGHEAEQLVKEFGNRLTLNNTRFVERDIKREFEILVRFRECNAEARVSVSEELCSVLKGENANHSAGGALYSDWGIGGDIFDNGTATLAHASFESKAE